VAQLFFPSANTRAPPILANGVRAVPRITVLGI
jgi:hypothetical protein